MKNNNSNKPFKEPPMSLELIGLLEHRKVEFVRKFGRRPRPGEPLFFDPASAVPSRLPADGVRRVGAMVAELTGLPEKVAADLVCRW